MSDVIYRQQAIDELNRQAVAMESWHEHYQRERKGILTAVNIISDLPTARINLNERIKVKLTDCGKEIYYHRFDDVFRQTELSVFKPEFPKTDEEGYTTFQLWDFIHIYGNYIDMGLPAVIKPLEIVYVGD